MKLKEKVGRGVAKVCGLAAAGLGGGAALLSGKGMAFALDTTVQEALSNQNVDPTTGSAIDALNSKVAGLGQAGYKLIFTAAIFILIIGLVIAGIMFAIANTQNRQDAKDRLIHIAIGTIIVTAAVAIITALASFGQGLAGTKN